MKKLISIAIYLLLVNVAFANDLKKEELDRAIQIVKEFSHAEENVDTDENYNFIVYVVNNIGQLNTKEKIRLMIDTCKHYTPTDSDISVKACDKIKHLASKNGINVDYSILIDDASPLLNLAK